MKRAIICDIDGVIADCTHRLKYLGPPADWDTFFDACVDDVPIKPMINLLQSLSVLFDIIYLTGRPEKSRHKTASWLVTNEVPSIGDLYMRPDGDHRHDYVVKKEILKYHLSDLDIAAVFEDRDRVVEMWRSEGLLCLQPQKGNY